MKLKKIIATVFSYAGFAIAGIMGFAVGVEPHNIENFVFPFISILGLASVSTWWLRIERRKKEEISLLKFVIKNGGKAT
ncbi:MAG: hypothetical protein KTR26_12805, partial [Flammeovirgaceae bacterium]|nr:hypothetical protein [Flammeovirgaceae bacterium]